uniref:Autophagy-related protein 2 n=1 Tax=Aceria tosichella TaxID=561515 RepID=A0A6G1S9H3_9ACAR
MPLYIPWLTETIKKRGVRYLLHHYLGQFFEEKLTLDQLSIDIYEGKGSIRNLALDVDGLNDELDFIPFRFLEGCLIGQISVEVPWSSLATDACKVELDGAKFYCRLKTSADANKPHCTESTLLSRSLMTSSMQMAEEIVTTEDDDESDCSMNHHHSHANLSRDNKGQETSSTNRRKDANQMFEGLEMFAQLIDSVLRRTKLTAHNTLFQIKPYHEKATSNDDENETISTSEINRPNLASSSRSSGDEFSEPLAKSGTDDEEEQDANEENEDRDKQQSKSTVEFFIKFFRCEEMIDQTRAENSANSSSSTTNTNDNHDNNDGASKSLSAIPETITKLLTLEDVEMRIDGIPVSNLVGKHTITIKFNGQKSEISIFSGSPLLAVISHKQLETFFNVFDGVKDQNSDASFMAEKDQKLMSPEDYAKIENQLLESPALRNVNTSDLRSASGFDIGGVSSGSGAKSVISNSKNSYYGTAQVLSGTGGGARRWVDSGDLYSEVSYMQTRESEYGFHSHLSPQCSADLKQSSCETTTEPTLDHIEAFSCELKLPGIWLCILRAGESLPPLIKPFADSINSFQSINKYIDSNIKVPHIRFLALKVALDITASGTNIFLGDLDISEYLEDTTRMSPFLRILNNDQANVPMSSSRYKASITNGKEITIDLLTKTRIMFDPTIIDRIVYDYKLIKFDRSNANHHHHPSYTHSNMASSQVPNHQQQRSNHLDLNLTIRAEQFKVELLCPIPDLTPDASMKRTQLRPQSFIFDFKDVNLTWRMDQLRLSSTELMAFVKTQPKQLDSEAVRFIEATCKENDKIVLLLEPSPSNLDNDFTNDIEQALNESSMYESIYVSQATESRIPTEPFQTKRKVVRASFQSQQTSNKPNSARISECDHEKILTPGDRQHLLEYLNQTVMSTRLSLNLHLPICEVEFEDKEQLDLIYNRFGNDFVFWQPRTFAKDKQTGPKGRKSSTLARSNVGGKEKTNLDLDEPLEFKPVNQFGDQIDTGGNGGDQLSSDADNEGSEISYHSMSHHHNKRDMEQKDELEDKIGSTDIYDNEVTCKIIVDELFVRFNHQSCAAALKQEISANNLLLGVVIDVNKKPNTLLSLVADNLELSNELETVLEGNFFSSKESIFGLTAEIKRPTKTLKDIKLAIQLKDGLFNDFRTETYTRFWQSINVTDEPILGYVAPQIITELHIDILNIGLLLVRDGARPALLSIDELYLTSMVMEQTSQVMIRLIADEVSLYMKRDRQGLEVMKNYICLVDSGLIDLDVKFGGDSRLEFGVINNVITVRVCQDSLSALCKLFNVLVKSANQGGTGGDLQQTNASHSYKSTSSSEKASDVPMFHAKHLSNEEGVETTRGGRAAAAKRERSNRTLKAQVRNGDTDNTKAKHEYEYAPAGAEGKGSGRNREMNLLVDAMNDYAISSSNSSYKINRQYNDASALEPEEGGGGRTKRRTRRADDEKQSDRDDDVIRKDKTTTNRSDDSDQDRDERGEDSGSENGDNSDSDASRDSSDDDGDEKKKRGRREESDDNEYDSDAPPAFQRATSTQGDGDDDDDGAQLNDSSERQPGACLLDESNPMLANLFSQPLMPTELNSAMQSSAEKVAQWNMRQSGRSQNLGENSGNSRPTSATGSGLDGQDDDQMTTTAAMDESGFFVIGDDDIGAGIIDKKQHEPLVRKLISEPINIVENHFKMKRPRLIPEALAACLERYVLEEMTLVVNLYGGRDFDDENLSANDDASSSTTNDHPGTVSGGDQSGLEAATNELQDTISAESQSIRSRAGSMACGRRQPCAEFTSGSLKRNSLGSGRLGGRRKHLSEGSGGGARLEPAGLATKAVEQRVRFGEGAVNLWESLDLMSAPDFLGGGRHSGPTQPVLSSESKLAGGTWRENDVCIQLTLSKVKLLYELADGRGAGGATLAKVAPQAASAATATTTTTTTTYSQPEPDSNLTPPISWRFMLFIQDIEVKDRIAASDINKILYEYCNESMPKRNTQMLTIKNVATINPSDGCEECDLRVSLKPLRLNIDQDTLLFLIEFFTTFCKSLTKQQSIYAAAGATTATSGSTGAPATQATTTTTSTPAAAANRSSGNSMAGQLVNLSKQASDNSPGVLSKTTIVGCRQGTGQRVVVGGGGGGGGAIRYESSDAARGAGKDLNLSRPQVAGKAGGGSGARGPASSGSSQEVDSLSSSSLSASSSSSSSSSTTNLAAGASRSSAANSTAQRRSGAPRSPTETAGSVSCGKKSIRERINTNTTKTTTGRRGIVVANSTCGSGNNANANSNNNNPSSVNDYSNTTTTNTVNDDDNDEDDDDTPLPTHCHTDCDLSGAANQQPIYIKSFTFSPDVPIRIDYHAKHLNFEQGALAGILMGLADLDHSELILRRVKAKHGMRGLDRVLVFAINSWLSDIKRNQLPGILGGVGPMHSVIQLFQGLRDLVWMPIDHYRKDGRLVRGLQRGASSFSSSTAMAAINLVNRFISIVQCTAQIAHDIVTPPTMAGPNRSSNHRRRARAHRGGQSVSSLIGGGGDSGAGASGCDLGSSSSRRRHHHHYGHSAQHNQGHLEVSSRLHGLGGSGSSAALASAAGHTGGGLNQPRNFCEGVAVGFTILKEGFNDTARNVTVGMQADDMRSAVGELVRQIPSTLLNPIISATEGAQSVLVGIRNQIAPDARKDDQEKWKGRVRGK